MACRDFEHSKARVIRLVEGARKIAAPSTEIGQTARQRLIETTGLSAQGVEYALERCLETNPTEAELSSLIRRAPEAAQAHVLLSANVFVAAHRAIAIALAASAHVKVRPSRREPVMAELLNTAAPELFTLTPSLHPNPGDHVFAYGSDTTLANVKTSLAKGVIFHAHGSGIGVVLVELDQLDSNSPDEVGVIQSLARELALDVAAFDQRGCLSPRCVLAHGSPSVVQWFCEQLARALSELEARIPLGTLTQHEAAEVTRFRDTAAFAADLVPAGNGWLSRSDAILIPPIGRNIHVTRVVDFGASLAQLGNIVASIGSALRPNTEAALRKAFPNPRWARVGRMQTPPFDGPVDTRVPVEGEQV